MLVSLQQIYYDLENIEEEIFCNRKIGWKSENINMTMFDVQWWDGQCVHATMVAQSECENFDCDLTSLKQLKHCHTQQTEILSKLPKISIFYRNIESFLDLFHVTLVIKCNIVLSRRKFKMKSHEKWIVFLSKGFRFSFKHKKTKFNLILCRK